MVVRLDPLILHKAQSEIYRDDSRFKMLLASRRFGKTRLLLTTTISKAFGFNGHYDPYSPPCCVIAAETLKQCTALYWSQLLAFFENKPFTKKINRQDHSIELHGSKPTIYVRGCDGEGENLRGLKLYFAGIDEVQQVSDSVISEVIAPALADTALSSSLYIGTPRGKNNIAYRLSQEYQNTEGYSYFHKTVYDNPFFPQKEIDRLKSNLSERTFRQEMLAEFVDFRGQVFTEFLPDDHSLLIEPTEHSLTNTYIGIDPGVNNLAFVIFTIDEYSRFRVLDSVYDNEVRTVSDILDITKELSNKIENWKGKLQRVFVPDDREDIKISLNRAGFNQAVLVKRSAVGPAQRAEIVNNLFKQGRLLIDSRQKDFISEISSYHRDTDKEGHIKESIAPKQVDHRIDALSYGICNIFYKNKYLFGTTLIQ